jgi:antitoxin (DNA-binding transcriptional repressor) of toxin-antitoxin stability system
VKTIKLSHASRPLAEYATKLSEEIVVVTEHNRPVAAIVPLRGVDRELIALSAHPAFLKIIARSRAEFRRSQTISLAEMNAAFGRSPNKRLQPTKARRSRDRKRGSARLRG